MDNHLGLKSVSGAPTRPIFQKVLETARGGFSLDTTGLTADEIIPAGTAISYDETTRKAKVANVDGSDVKGLLYEDVKVTNGAPVDVVIRGTVYLNRIPETPEEVIAALPLIIFSESF